jgi:hypothetical protein
MQFMRISASSRLLSGIPQPIGAALPSIRIELPARRK